MIVNLFLLEILAFSYIHCLICYPNQSFSFTSTQLNWSNLSDIIPKTLLSNQTVSKSSCHVRLTVDSKKSNTEYGRVTFDSSTSNVSNTSIEFGTTLTFVGNKIQSMVSYLDYRCSSKNSCERQFLLKRVIPLLRTFEQPLHNNLLALWKNSSSTPFVCDPRVRQAKCLSYICFVTYNDLKHLSQDKSSCPADLALAVPIQIFVRTLANNPGRSTIEHEYRCAKNECTGQIFFNSKNQSDFTGSALTNRNRNAFFTQSNEIILKQVVAIVSILLIIASIAYVIQYRKYRQGYRRTATTA